MAGNSPKQVPKPPKGGIPASALKPAPKGQRYKKTPGSLRQKKLETKTGESFTDAQKMLRDKFITEYLRDFHATNAYIRTIGPEEIERRALSQKTVANYAYMMRHEPYVAMRLQKVLDDIEEKELVTRKEILVGLKREAHYDEVGAQHGARVAAWSRLSSILGMETKKVEMNLASQGGILIVPQTQNTNDWEKRSTEAQRALKDAVRK